MVESNYVAHPTPLSYHNDVKGDMLAGGFINLSEWDTYAALEKPVEPKSWGPLCPDPL